ncbi:histidine kinase [Verticiella sediminum]|uniref:histidine kinase n=1 Tax=Verticiella sediminum TaxID=1247510 RepID=A0A556ALS5_9BURK|nr:ATP-binding protein [Verticiella sediminum]TSH93833.1 histidine kinase [Verticiella sediminum]
MTRALLVCAAWLWLALAHAAPVTVAVDAHTAWPRHLSEAAEAVEDVDGTLTLGDVARLPPGQPESWRPVAAWQTRPGMNASAWWLRMTVRNDGDRALDLVVTPGSPRLGDVDYYLLAQRPEGTAPSLPDPAAQAPAAAGSRTNSPPSRYQALEFSLSAGQSADIYMRVRNLRFSAVQPKIYENTAFEARERRAALWDGVLIGGLSALAWATLVIAALARSLPFLWLSLLSAIVAAHEYIKRGYPRLYLGADSPLLDERVPLVVLPLIGLLLLAFALQLGQREGIRIPGRVWFIALMMVAALRLVAAFVIGPAPLMFTIQTAMGMVLSVSVLAAALVMLIRRDPSARLILIGMAISLANLAVQLLVEGGSNLPVLRWLDMDLEPHPVTGLLHLGGNLAIMAAWIHHVGRQRNQARDELVERQLTEQERLRREVAQRTTELNDALKYAEAQNRQKVETLGYITHDLRAPLATISGYTRLLAATQTPDQEPHIQAIERSVGYQMAMIDELLEYARGELAPLEVHSGAVELSKLLEEVAGFGATLGARQGNRLVYEPPPVLPRLVRLDGRRLQQVLLNLLSNAAKFTHRGTITLKLNASPAENAWRLDFSVADTGIGIDLADRMSVFDAFRQIQRGQGGVGLGLYIAQNIVRALGGELQVESSVGNGSRFSFTLSVQALDITPVRPRRLAPHPAPPHARPVPHAGRALPDAGERLHLAALARDGRLSDIEQWLATMAEAGTRYDTFLPQVRQRLQMLDFEGIEALALASDPHG